MIKDKDHLFCFAFSTLFKPEMVVAIAKDLGKKEETQIDEDLTILANKKREYFSSVNTE